MKLKKLISIILAVSILSVILILPANAGDTSNSDFEIKDGVLVKYNGIGGNVVIPSGVTSIGDNVFMYCTGLTGITIPDSVTSIGSDAFSYSGLTDIAISKNVVSIGKSAFTDCQMLKSITVDKDNKYYCSEDGVLYNYRKSILVQYPAGIQNDTFTISDSVIYIDMESCVGAAFKTVNIPDGVIDIGIGAFTGCQNMTGIDIPDSVKEIGLEAFCKCTGLKSVAIPNGVMYVGNEAFINCSGLTSVTVPASVISLGNAPFTFCPSLTDINVATGNTVYYSEDGVLYDGISSSLIKYPEGKIDKTFTIPDNIEEIGADSFCMSGLSEIKIPDSVTTIGDSAFAQCNALTDVVIPSSVKSIGKMSFYDCEALKSVTVKCFDTQIGYASFRGDGLTIYSTQGSYAQTYARDTGIKFATIGPVIGTPKLSTAKPTNGNVTVTVPVTGASVKSLSCVFTANGSHTFKVTDNNGLTAVRTVTVSNIDKTNPAIKLSSAHDKITVTVTDANLSAKSAKLDGKAVKWPSNNTFMAKGSYVVTAVDKAGNISASAFTIK